MSVTPSRTEPRGTSQALGARVFVAALALFGAGCGDSLLGSFGLSQNLGLGLDLPADAAWSMRWYAGPGAPTVGTCALLPATGDESDEGFSMSGPTPLPSPLASIDGGSFAWSLGLPLVSDGGEPTASDAQPNAGIWGIAPFHAVLVATGDIDGFEQQLEIGTVDGTPLAEGAQWVELFLDAQAPTDLRGAIATTAQQIPMTDRDGDVPVEPMDPDGLHRDLLVLTSGADPLGGLTIPDCAD